jgi:hypothetical protein
MNYAVRVAERAAVAKRSLVELRFAFSVFLCSAISQHRHVLRRFSRLQVASYRLQVACRTPDEPASFNLQTETSCAEPHLWLRRQPRYVFALKRKVFSESPDTAGGTPILFGCIRAASSAVSKMTAVSSGNGAARGQCGARPPHPDKATRWSWPARSTPCSGYWDFFASQPGFLLLQPCFQVLQRGHAQQVKLNQLHHPLAGSPPGIKLQQQRRDQRQINLNRHSFGRFGQPVTTTQNAFDPAEEQFDLPPAPIQLRDQRRAQFLRPLVGHQQKHFLRPLHPHQAPAPAAVARLATQHRPRLPHDPRRSILFTEG